MTTLDRTIAAYESALAHDPQPAAGSLGGIPLPLHPDIHARRRRAAADAEWKAKRERIEAGIVAQGEGHVCESDR